MKHFIGEVPISIPNNELRKLEGRAAETEQMISDAKELNITNDNFIWIHIFQNTM